jgi:hypothetical protein
MTDMMYFPEHKIAVAVQVNTSVPRDLGKPLSRVLWEVLDVVRTALGQRASISEPRIFQPSTSESQESQGWLPYTKPRALLQLRRLQAREI